MRTIRVCNSKLNKTAVQFYKEIDVVVVVIRRVVVMTAADKKTLLSVTTTTRTCTL